MANSELVYESNGTLNRLSGDNTQEKGTVDFAHERQKTSTSKQTKTSCMQSVRNYFRKRGFSQQSTDIFMSSWRNSTKKQYDIFIKRWFFH